MGDNWRRSGEEEQEEEDEEEEAVAPEEEEEEEEEAAQLVDGPGTNEFEEDASGEDGAPAEAADEPVVKEDCAASSPFLVMPRVRDPNWHKLDQS